MAGSPNIITRVSGVNYVSLKTRSFTRMLIANSDTTDVRVNLVLGESDTAGGSSVASTDRYILKDVIIPKGTTLKLEAMDFTRTADTPGTASSNIDDLTFLLATTNAAYQVDVSIIR